MLAVLRLPERLQARLGHRRKGHRELAPLAHHRGDPNLPTVTLGDLARDVEAEAEAAEPLPIVRAIEALEDVRDAIRADADSLIGNSQRERTASKALKGHRYGPPFRAVLRRIVEEIHEKLLPTQGIDMRAHSGFDAQIPLMAPIVRQPRSLNGPLHDR